MSYSVNTLNQDIHTLNSHTHTHTPSFNVRNSYGDANLSHSLQRNINILPKARTLFALFRLVGIRFCRVGFVTRLCGIGFLIGVGLFVRLEVGVSRVRVVCHVEMEAWTHVDTYIHVTSAMQLDRLDQ